jgi:hypothetical protein
VVVHPEVLVQLRESNPRTPRVLTVAKGNTEASVIGEDVKVRAEASLTEEPDAGKPHIRDCAGGAG